MLGNYRLIELFVMFRKQRLLTASSFVEDDAGEFLTNSAFPNLFFRKMKQRDLEQVKALHAALFPVKYD